MIQLYYLVNLIAHLWQTVQIMFFCYFFSQNDFEGKKFQLHFNVESQKSSQSQLGTSALSERMITYTSAIVSTQSR